MMDLNKIKILSYSVKEWKNKPQIKGKYLQKYLI